jgi:hypothetical protein
MFSNEFKKELSKVSLEELIQFCREEQSKLANAKAAKRYTLGRVDAIVETTAVDKNHLNEYLISVPAGILCYVRAGAHTLSKELSGKSTIW